MCSIHPILSHFAIPKPLIGLIGFDLRSYGIKMYISEASHKICGAGRKEQLKRLGRLASETSERMAEMQ